MSLQLDNFLALRARGTPWQSAAEHAGIGIEEARLWEDDIASGAVVLPSLERGEGGRGQAIPPLTQQGAATPDSSKERPVGNVAKQHANPPSADALAGHAPEPLPRVCAPAPAPAREGNEQEEASMEDVTTTIRVGNGPEIPVNLNDLDAPENADAKEAIGQVIGEALAKPATDTGERLKRYIERVERLDEEIKALNEDKSDLFKEMKSNGFDTKTIKRILKLRKMEPHERQEAEALLQTYMDAIGMTPIEQAIALAA